MKKIYSVCKKLICIEAEYFPGDNPLWAQFEAESNEADINIRCTVREPFPEMQGEAKGTAGEFSVSVDGDWVYRAFPMIRQHGALTKYTPADTSYSETFFTAASFPIMMDGRYMWSSVSLAQLLLPKNAFFMHSSFISVNGKGILFSANSGTGKSTQAALWEKYRGAEVINGDKAGVLVENGVYACGVPFCGTSGICKNKALPLGAIILLGQAPENKIRRLSGLKALQGILQNVYLDLLAPNEQTKIFDLLIELLGAVPVYSLECTPDEKAVEALENALQNGGVI
ncbi:MAG: hypothetical protein E7516_09675 [Ruminococcaceae bacterium]|nr:hypothetical protein [Oscillospiraceae bacterium]